MASQHRPVQLNQQRRVAELYGRSENLRATARRTHPPEGAPPPVTDEAAGRHTVPPLMPHAYPGGKTRA